MGQDPLPLAGIKVVELTVAVAGPSCACMLADYGADVVKVEPPRGDTHRTLIADIVGRPMASPYLDSSAFYQINRNKRSMVLDLKTSSGLAMLNLLLKEADVFVSNLRLQALAQFQILPEQLSKRYPGLVVCQMTGWGMKGPDANKPVYDLAGFWARSGAAYYMTPEGTGYPPNFPPGFGDLTTGMAAAGGIMAALVEKARTGRGRIVTTSLMRTGMHVNGWASSKFFARDRLTENPRWGRRDGSGNPLLNVFRTLDNKHLYLLGLESTRHWPGVCRALQMDPAAEDFRSAPLRSRNESKLLALMDKIMLTKTRADWATTLDQEGVWWCPMQDMVEVWTDEQAHAAGAFIEYPQGPADRSAAKQYKYLRNVAAPVDFLGSSPTPRRHVPSLGEHTREVLEDWIPETVRTESALCQAVSLASDHAIATRDRTRAEQLRRHQEKKKKRAKL